MKVNSQDPRRNQRRKGDYYGLSFSSSLYSPVPSAVPDAAIPDSKAQFFELVEHLLPYSQEKTRDLNSLLRDLPDAERNFLKSPTYENLNVYKRIVQAILREVMDRNTSVETLRSRARGGSEKIYQLINTVDDKVQTLADFIIHPDNSTFDLMKRMEDIRGLLVDLMN
ncbi:PF03885 family protein [Leptospira broomii serovar Hurstbridge str. 5399]|uniref:PF03885 family protein n=1 Tax=Leptospira broomii serovar Hurstbridge str. 5399 TaxID=1049789 RepID=T0FCA1_9LEPT|nr:YaaR family protein [Leptospira broomii]EQA45212.1 PF03885 family protein [Leptospira broomii serovar Hurstbridge str. 5399]